MKMRTKMSSVSPLAQNTVGGVVLSFSEKELVAKGQP
jgi:hypothetical protein